MAKVKTGRKRKGMACAVQFVAAKKLDRKFAEHDSRLLNECFNRYNATMTPGARCAAMDKALNSLEKKLMTAWDKYYDCLDAQPARKRRK